MSCDPVTSSPARSGWKSRHDTAFWWAWNERSASRLTRTSKSCTTPFSSAAAKRAGACRLNWTSRTSAAAANDSFADFCRVSHSLALRSREPLSSRVPSVGWKASRLTAPEWPLSVRVSLSLPFCSVSHSTTAPFTAWPVAKTEACSGCHATSSGACCGSRRVLPESRLRSSAISPSPPPPSVTVRSISRPATATREPSGDSASDDAGLGSV